MTTPKNTNQIKVICHPYLFALKEGSGINNDLLDYSLLLLQRQCTEIMRSPKKAKIKSK